MLTDTHAHLDFADFASDLPEVLGRAETAGVARFISIGTTVESSQRAVTLAENDPRIFATAGIHPGNAEEAPPDAVAAIRKLAQHPRIVALGEIGLDYYRLPSKEPGDELNARYKATQAAIFEQQLDLAVALGLNVVIHQREAWDDTLQILERYTGKLKAVFHCFGETLPRARKLLDLGHLVSFTGIVTFKNAKTIQDVAAALPPDAFMVETDCPYLAPVPFRGKRCEPAYTRQTADFIAALRGISIEQLAGETEATAKRFFRFS
jgi:TatD DNase family protein